MSISSFVSGVAGAIAGGISAVGNAIGTLATTICGGLGGAIGALSSGFCSALIGGISALGIGDIIGVIMVISKVISWIAEKLGLTEEQEQPEEIGMKAEQADKKPEDFDSIEEYIKYLREEIEIDKEKMEKLSEEEKAAYATVGSAILVQGIEEKYKMQLPAEFWCTVVDKKMSNEQVQGLIETFKENGLKDMKDFSDYMNDQSIESGTPRSKISDTIIETIKKQNPGMDQEELNVAFDQLMTEHRK